MTTVFLSGSRSLGRLNDDIRGRIDNMIDKDMKILIGDANGADKAMQAYLASRNYGNVTVFFVGDKFRNNVGDWETHRVSARPGYSGRAFYALKDREMATFADFGLVLWDGKSAGSIENVLELLKGGKKIVVYFGPEKRFYTLSEPDDVARLLGRCSPAQLSAIRKKVNIDRQLNEIATQNQLALGLG